MTSGNRRTRFLSSLARRFRIFVGRLWRHFRPSEGQERMANEQPTGPLTIADFCASDWEQAIDGCSKKESFHFAAALGREASVAENSGDLRRTQLFRFLAEAASIGWESGASGEVFGPRQILPMGS